MSRGPRKGTGRGRGGPPAGGARRGPSGRPSGGGRRPRPPALDEGGAGPGGAGGGRRGLGGDQVEGLRAVRELLIAGRRRPREVLLGAEVEVTGIVEEILALAHDTRVPVERVSRGKLDAVARTDSPQGVVARAAPLDPVDVDDLASGAARSDVAPDGPPFLLALDGVTDPSELGLVLRAAVAAGVTGVVLPRHRAVHVTPTAARAAAGAIEHLPLAVVGGLPAALGRLHDQGLWTLGVDADAERPLWGLEALDVPLVVAIGPEVRGLSRLVRQRCDRVVGVPQAGGPDGLDTAAVATLACFEVARGRAG